MNLQQGSAGVEGENSAASAGVQTSDHAPAGNLQSEPPGTTTQGLSRLEQSVEVAIFLFLMLPSMVLNLFAVQEGRTDFSLTALALIFRDLGLMSLILFFLWRNGEKTATIGLLSQRLWFETALGLALYVPVLLAVGLLEMALLRAGLTGPTARSMSFLEAHGTVAIILEVVLVAVAAVTEETIFRGYLLLRLRAVLGNTTAAVLLSAALFAIGHGYEGIAGMIAVGTLGIIFAVIYLWRGSLAAPIVMHFLQDFLSLILLPMLGQKQ